MLVGVLAIVAARSTPAPLALESPAAAAPAVTPPPDDPLAVTCGDPGSSLVRAGNRLSGIWSVEQATAGYRAHERYAGITAPHQAVARTERVAGWARVSSPSDARASLERACFAVDLYSLRSVDEMPGFNMNDRDTNVHDMLAVSQYPYAILTLDTTTIAAAAGRGGRASLTIPGELTMKGVTRPVRVATEILLGGERVSVAGHTVVSADDYGIEIPRDLSFIDVDPRITVEFTAVLHRAAGTAR
jgi:polyisoprenoid-binding protein YceI